jgi:hypothetical protein
MGKTGVFGTLIGKMGETQLPDSSQTLEFSRIDQTNKQFSFGAICF